MFKYVRVAAIGVAGCLLGSGCASYRGIPSHGGGKRFDEEQRVVSGAIRYAIADMRLKELKGRRVKVQTVSIPTSGSGNMTYGGLQDINLGLAYSELVNDLISRVLPQPYSTTRDSRTSRWNEETQQYEPFQRINDKSNLINFSDRNQEEDEERTSGNIGLRYRLDHSFFTSRENTEGDVRYLMSVMDMKARHDGISVVGEKPDTVLFVLVDVLGTNRRRNDLILWKRDDLAATCEMTYYALDVRNGTLLFPARRAAGRAVYVENRIWPLGLQTTSRKFTTAELSPIPISGAAGDRLVLEPALPKTVDANGESNGVTPEQQAEELVQFARGQLRAGQFGDARNTLRQVIKLDPENQGLREIEDEFNLDLPLP